MKQSLVFLQPLMLRLIVLIYPSVRPEPRPSLLLTSMSANMILLPVTGCFIFVFWLFLGRSTRNPTSNFDISRSPMVLAWLFFTKRYDFISDTFKRTGQKMFRFRVLQYNVVALAGEEGRKLIFSEKNFNFREGYRILGAQAPRLQDINIKTEDNTNFAKLILNLFRKERVVNVTPYLLEDAERRMDQWGNDVKINPFEEMHSLVFQMTIRMATCRELADNLEATARLSELFLLHEQALSPISFFLPWFPGRAKQTKQKATTAMFELLSRYVDLRRKSSVKSSDVIDTLIADGYDDSTIIDITLGIIFAGVFNTGMVACWTLIHLGDKFKWKAKVAEEVAALLLNYASESDPTQRRFSAVPLDAWEEEMPNLDFVIKETMRFNLAVIALRRNLGGDMVVGENTIRDGDFVAYSFGDAHLNDQIYSDPFSFDPARFSDEEHQDKSISKVSLPFLGWGAGRHPCPGMRAAKLEIKLAVAMFLSKFDYDIVDASGKYPKRLPRPDRNNIQGAKPIGDPCYFKLQKKI
ncbi:Lanosterol 14-alpha demethylase [Mycena sanguinolenta]|uniref:Lanosterol 14-alpha demethylase n=1 Tax=Mycena sanguinolenta TaxID=230812 RepID=A0A8H6YDW9_9AGAR|nr:Lanosterol 14-alpha demethylase [Mycena sanguinolenta]